MAGGTGDDGQDGGPGNDTIYANRGDDISVGGDGNDVLWALARADVSGPGDVAGDTLDGGNGDDVLRTRDGEADSITCGAGNDAAFAGRRRRHHRRHAREPQRLLRDGPAQGAEGQRDPLRGRAGEARRRADHELARAGGSDRVGRHPAADPPYPEREFGALALRVQAE